MYLAGWQKLSLVDYPGKVACTLFTGGCNLRCPYCHNSELLEGDMPRVDTSEVLAYLDHRKGILDGVVVSGGEPCMQPDLLDFLATLKGKNLLVKLDTNGCYPDVLGKGPGAEPGGLRGHGSEEQSGGVCHHHRQRTGAFGKYPKKPGTAVTSKNSI